MGPNNSKKKVNSSQDESDFQESSESKSRLSDTLKKILSSGSASEISKELLGTVVSQVLKTKDDIASKATNEMITLIRKIDFVKEISKFAETHKFKISAEIEILKKDSTNDILKK